MDRAALTDLDLWIDGLACHNHKRWRSWVPAFAMTISSHNHGAALSIAISAPIEAAAGVVGGAKGAHAAK
jgi:hypothetical protein